MAKCVLSISGAYISGGIFTVGYTCAAIDDQQNEVNFGADYNVNTALSPSQLLSAIKAKAISDCSGMGITVSVSDVIVFGISG